MTAPIPTIEPTVIVAGDTLKWQKTLENFPASQGWTLTYTLINATGKRTFTATADGDSFLVTVAASTTATWAAGSYSYRGQVAKAGEVYTISTGTMTVQPSFAAATLDDRSQAQKMLDAVNAVLEGRATSAVAEYEIAGRQLKYISIPDLLKLRDRLRFDVQREENADRAAAGLPPKGRINVRFGA